MARNGKVGEIRVGGYRKESVRGLWAQKPADAASLVFS